MSMRRIQVCLLTAVCIGLVGVTGGSAFGFGSGAGAGGDCGNPCPPAPCGPTTQKIKVTEYVPTWVEECVTVNKPTWQTQTYTAYRWECVPECVEKQVTTYKKVCDTVMVDKCITERVPVMKTVTCYEKVPVTKTVTVNQMVWKTIQVTEMRTKTVTHKVHTTECVEQGPSLHDRLKAKCDPCYCPCPRYKEVCRTHKVCETVCCPVTVCKKVCECVPCTKTICTYECVPVQKQVCTYECVTRHVKVPCTVTKCVPCCETVKCTVMVKKCVPYTCTKQVCVNVPCQEKVKVCKLVPVCVEKDVCVAPCGPACNPCDDHVCCSSSGGLFGKLKGRMGGMRKHKGGCCEPTGCESACGGAAAGCCH